MIPYDKQLEAVTVAEKLGRGTIVAVTGYGKSVIMALLINRLQLKTLVVVPTVGLKNQLRNFMSRVFGSLQDIDIENIDSPKLHAEKNYDLLIIDEAHHVAAKTYRQLNVTAWANIYHRFFFTATPFRSKSEEQLLYEAIAGQVIYRIPYQQAVADGAIVPLEAYYYDLPKTPVEGYTWAEVYKELVTDNAFRNCLIASTIDKLALAGAPTLCLVKEIDHGQAIVDASQVKPVYAKGENDDNSTIFKAFNEGKIKTLLGTNGVLGEGIDTRPAEWVIIAGLGKSKNQFMQAVGRGFRRSPGKESCKILIFKDKSHKWTREHFNAQVRYLREEYGVMPVKLELPG